MPRVAFPHLDTLSLAAEKYLGVLGVEIFTPPPISCHTLDLGVQNTPEVLCIPCKLLFGNYLEAAECGATDIVMFGGPGTCRLGYTVNQFTERLHKMGFNIQPHPLDLSHIQGELFHFTHEFAPDRSLRELVGPIRFLLDLLDLNETLETQVLQMRPRELERGAVDRAFATSLKHIVALENRNQLQTEREAILAEIGNVAQDMGKPVLRIGVVGDLYTMFTPFLNHNMEIELGRMGVEVHRWFHSTGMINAPLPLRLRQDRAARAQRAGDRYLGRNVGGFARSAVGEAALMAEGEVDGLIHVAPFNCTPEIVAQGALVQLQREKGTPVLNLSFDEQTGRAGVLTRLEAFVDMLWNVRNKSIHKETKAP